jgi:hypothetical protein
LDLASNTGARISRINFSDALHSSPIPATAFFSLVITFAMTDAARLLSNANVLLPRAGGVHAPPEVLLSWPRPNYINPETRGWEASIVLLIIVGITFLIFVARIWARLVIAKSAGLDDVLISIAMLPVLGLTISAVLGMLNTTTLVVSLLTFVAIQIYGFQWHAWDQTNETHITSRKVRSFS